MKREADATHGVLDESGLTARELFDEAPIGYVATRADGSIVQVNRTFLKWTGHAHEALAAGEFFQRLLTVPGRIYYDTHVAPLLAMQGFVREVALELTRSGRPSLPVLVNFERRPGAGPQAGFILITVFDATDRRQYERELLRARRAADEAAALEREAREQAQAANRARDDFLALVSHELKNPLSAIFGWGKVLHRQAGDNREILNGLAVIERNAQLLARLVDDLNDLSRVISGKLRLDVRQVNLASIVAAAIDTVRPTVESNRLRLEVALEDRALVSGDAGRLQQVFWNLLSNAIKFTPREGTIRVQMQRAGAQIELRIIDSGQGMKPDFIAHAFDRFRQSDSPTVRTTSGLGLGLSLVRHLVEMHAGTVEARSEGEGLGSTFIVRLPALVSEETHSLERWQVPPEAPAPDSTERAPSLSGVRVLLVQPDRRQRELVWRALMRADAEVIAVVSTAEALATLQRFRPDVLVSDNELPDGDGCELIARVRALGERAGRVAALALSCAERPEVRARILLAGYQSHLFKPIDTQALTIAVANLAGRSP